MDIRDDMKAYGLTCYLRAEMRHLYTDDITIKSCLHSVAFHMDKILFIWSGPPLEMRASFDH